MKTETSAPPIALATHDANIEVLKNGIIAENPIKYSRSQQHAGARRPSGRSRSAMPQR